MIYILCIHFAFFKAPSTLALIAVSCIDKFYTIRDNCILLRSSILMQNTNLVLVESATDFLNYQKGIHFSTKPRVSRFHGIVFHLTAINQAAETFPAERKRVSERNARKSRVLSDTLSPEI